MCDLKQQQEIMMKKYQVKLKLLKKLADGAFYSGSQLGEELGISRAAISKHIQGIEQWGVDIFRVQGRGYQLAQPMELLDEAILKSQLSSPLHLIPVIDSTNQYLLNNKQTLSSGTVCVAEYQTQGRGRRGRQWLSPFGANIYFSVYWRLEAGMAAAMGLSLVVGVALVEALESLGLVGVQLKWPNDLYYQKRKLAGILVEMSAQAGGAAHLVIGVGINLEMKDIHNNIDQPWANLNELMEENQVHRNQLTITCIKTLINALIEYEKKGMTGLVSRWNERDHFLNRKVKLLLGEREIVGIAQGIDEQGAIKLETSEGVQHFIGGEISLRGM